MVPITGRVRCVPHIRRMTRFTFEQKSIIHHPLGEISRRVELWKSTLKNSISISILYTFDHSSRSFFRYLYSTILVTYNPSRCLIKYLSREGTSESDLLVMLVIFHLWCFIDKTFSSFAPYFAKQDTRNVSPEETNVPQTSGKFKNYQSEKQRVYVFLPLYVQRTRHRV